LIPGPHGARAGRLLAGLLLAPAALLLASAPARANCTPTRQISGSHTWQYVNCSVVDLDQLRAPGPGGAGGLPNNGDMYCVPTSAMDWMVYLAKWGYIPTIPNFPIPIPPNKDWTDSANFNEMSRYLHLMGNFMGTTPTGGTGGSGLVNGVDTWLLLNAIKGKTTPLPGIVKVFQQVTNYNPDPNAMGEDAASGALVMVNIGFYDSDGNRTGGHEVVLQQGSNNDHSSVVIHVMDPNDPKIEDHVQSPYTPEQWTLFPRAGGGWSITTGPPGVSYGTPRYDGYSAIEPEYVFSSDAPAMIVDRPFVFGESTVHPRQASRFKLQGTGPVLDFAIAPEGFEEPYIARGSSQIRQVDALDGTVSPLADGPAGAAHLAFGGPTQTLFVSGASQLVGLDRTGHQIASAKLAHTLDALAFDDHGGRLVGISAAQRRLTFYSPELHTLGSIGVPARMLAGRGALSLDVSRAGVVLIHRDGQPAIGVIKTANGKLNFRTERLFGVSNPRGLAVDDRNHLFFDVRGHLAELLANGHPVKGSVFDGMPAAGIVHVARSYSNAPSGVLFQ
jgi:hypothetical protein